MISANQWFLPILVVLKSCLAKNASGHLEFQFFTKKFAHSLDHFKTFNFRVETLESTYNRTLKSLLKNQPKVQKVKNSIIFYKLTFFHDFHRFEIMLG